MQGLQVNDYVKLKNDGHITRGKIVRVNKVSYRILVLQTKFGSTTQPWETTYRKTDLEPILIEYIENDE